MSRIDNGSGKQCVSGFCVCWKSPTLNYKRNMRIFSNKRRNEHALTLMLCAIAARQSNDWIFTQPSTLPNRATPTHIQSLSKSLALPTRDPNNKIVAWQKSNWQQTQTAMRGFFYSHIFFNYLTDTHHFFLTVRVLKRLEILKSKRICFC